MSLALKLGSTLQQSETLRKVLRKTKLSGPAYAIYRKLAQPRSTGDGWQRIEVNSTTIELPASVDTMHITDEMPVMMDLTSTLAADDTMWDVGANVGLYTVLASNFCKEIISIEPDSNNRATLERVSNRNDTDSQIIDEPLTQTADVVDMTTRQSGNNHIVNQPEDQETRTVETTTGNQLVSSGIPKPNVAKIDVEGYEMAVLLGMDEIMDCLETIYVEIHPYREISPSPERVPQYLERQGYSVSTLSESINGRYTVCATTE